MHGYAYDKRIINFFVNATNKTNFSLRIMIKGGTFCIPYASDHLKLNEPEKFFLIQNHLNIFSSLLSMHRKPSNVGDPINDLLTPSDHVFMEQFDKRILLIVSNLSKCDFIYLPWYYLLIDNQTLHQYIIGISVSLVTR